VDSSFDESTLLASDGAILCNISPSAGGVSMSPRKHAMRFWFTLFAFLSAMSILLLGSSIVTEILSGFRVFTLSGSELTVTFSGIDRILLGLAVLSVFATLCFWLKLSGRG
jgi:hypothetical protein